jgi:hypothetical protein
MKGAKKIPMVWWRTTMFQVKLSGRKSVTLSPVLVKKICETHLTNRKSIV